MFTKPCVKQDGHLIEMVVKSTIFSLRGAKNWSGMVSRRQAVSNMKRRGRRDEVIRHLSYDGWSLEDCPMSLLLDMYWGIDVPLNYKGNWYAIDITLKGDRDSLNKKASVLSMGGYLDTAPVSEIDATAIWVVDPDNLPSAARIKDTLRAMSRQRLFVETYYL